MRQSPGGMERMTVDTPLAERTRDRSSTRVPYPAYKDSGIPWLGPVPAHWRVMKLKQACLRSALYGANEPASNYANEGVRFLRTTDIGDNGRLRLEGAVYLERELVHDYL